MTACSIRAVAWAGGRPLPFADYYLASFDPDGHDGYGSVSWSLDPACAMRFPTPADAYACWMMPSRVRPLRYDGRPNRPLTQFTIIISPLPPMEDAP